MGVLRRRSATSPRHVLGGRVSLCTVALVVVIVAATGVRLAFTAAVGLGFGRTAKESCRSVAANRGQWLSVRRISASRTPLKSRSASPIRSPQFKARGQARGEAKAKEKNRGGSANLPASGPRQTAQKGPHFKPGSPDSRLSTHNDRFQPPSENASNSPVLAASSANSKASLVAAEEDQETQHEPAPEATPARISNAKVPTPTGNLSVLNESSPTGQAQALQPAEQAPAGNDSSAAMPESSSDPGMSASAPGAVTLDAPEPSTLESNSGLLEELEQARAAAAAAQKAVFNMELQFENLEEEREDMVPFDELNSTRYQLLEARGELSNELQRSNELEMELDQATARINKLVEGLRDVGKLLGVGGIGGIMTMFMDDDKLIQETKARITALKQKQQQK